MIKQMIPLLFFFFPLKAHFVIHSIPKCGTHFIQKTLTEITGRATYSFGHINESVLSQNEQETRILRFHSPYTQEQATILKNHKTKLISMIRDPRDALVSLVVYMRHFKGKGILRDFFFVSPRFDEMSFDEQLTSVMTEPKSNYIEFYKARLKWSRSPRTYSVRYENLVGSKGGGDDLLQLIEIYNICRHIGEEKSIEECLEIGQRIYNKHGDEVVDGEIFEHAQVGSWKLFFNEEHKKIAKAQLGELLIELHYEKDLSW
jgi:hypothetical protein